MTRRALKSKAPSNLPAAFFLTVLSLATGPAFAYPSYEKLIPNSATFNPFLLEFAALAHRGQHVDDNLNPFGIDFENANEVWATLCADDSDGDGFSNGVELGDPGCSYTPGAAIGPPLSDPMDRSSVPANPGRLGPPYPPAIIVAHGALMIIAWVILAPFGIAIATIMKKGDDPIWFKVHRASLLLAVVLSCISFFMAIAIGESEDEGEFPPHFSNPHTASGLAVFLLAILQAVSGVLRVGGGKKKLQKRLLWEFGHQWLGRIVVIVAFFAVWTGLEMGFAYNSDGFEAGRILFGGLFGVSAIFLAYVALMRDKGIRMPWMQPKGATSETAVKSTA